MNAGSARNDYYEALGIEETASADEVKRAGRAASARAHPDRGGSTESFQAVRTAVAVLSDPEKRKEYDRQRSIDTEGPALGKAFSLVSLVIQECANQKVNVLEYDIISDAAKTGQNEVQRLNGERRAVLEQIAATKNLVARIKAKKGKKNLIKRMFESQVENLEIKLRFCDMEIELTREAIAVLNDHSFECDDAMPPWIGGFPRRSW